MKYFIFLFLLFGCTAVEQREVRSDATIKAKGMSCPMCSNNINRVLKKIPGVADAYVNLKSGVVVVEFKAGQKPALTDLVQAVNDAGFTGESAKYK